MASWGARDRRSLHYSLYLLLSVCLTGSSIIFAGPYPLWICCRGCIICDFSFFIALVYKLFIPLTLSHSFSLCFFSALVLTSNSLIHFYRSNFQENLLGLVHSFSHPGHRYGVCAMYRQHTLMVTWVPVLKLSEWSFHPHPKNASPFSASLLEMLNLAPIPDLLNWNQ